MLAYCTKGDASTTKMLVPHSYKFEDCRRVLAEFVISDEQTFTVVEGNGFCKLLHQLEPRFTIPSRFTIARDYYNLYLDEMRKLKDFLKKSCVRVCLTIDTWASCQNLNYMCLTAHSIDNDWMLHKRVLNFCLAENHKGETIAKAVEKCLMA
ncbi:zinc finger BED domain-containing protein RICESLEEPER 2-like [Canna indica]|uniref:Zinc finger BED domain-containing protein RICESLEEPER 2-like n=1 Tax=Canna indica TaxID=4628 RepID=A0AAQ3KGG1_9LILI|nr:zinc finger BED domain-containing protein RICESLEEPER 2-like [Canna indica]